MNRRPSVRLGGDNGSITVELSIITPVALVLLCLIALVGRTTSARSVVSEAARDGARAASIARSPGAAETAARQTADEALATGGARCASTTTTVDLAAFAPGDDVTVTVACTIALSDLGLIGVSSTRTISSTATSIIDVYRGSP